MIILAQMGVTDGQVEQNVRPHINAMHAAVSRGAKLIIFPELSLHGYVLESATTLSRSMETKDAIYELHRLAQDLKLITVVGAFIQDDGQCHISSVILGESSGIRFYHKQYLHKGEDQYVSAGSANAVLNLNGLKIGLGICADFTEPAFFQSYRKDNIDLILLSVLISANGYEKDIETLKRESMLTSIAFVNFIGKSGDWDCCGRSTMLHSGKTISPVNNEEQLISLDLNGLKNISNQTSALKL